MALAMNRVTFALLLMVIAAAAFVLVPHDDDDVAVHSISCSPAVSNLTAYHRHRRRPPAVTPSCATVSPLLKSVGYVYAQSKLAQHVYCKHAATVLPEGVSINVCW